MKVLVLTIITIVALSAVAYADVPATMTYQGILTDAGSIPVVDGNYSITFRLYDAVVSGNLLWEETQPIAVFGGVFTATLGQVTPFALQFDQPYWIAISVNGGGELTPRTALTTTPYSFSTSTIPDSVVTPAKIIGGAVVRSINGLSDEVHVRAEGGASVSVAGDTLVINAAAGGASNTPWNLSGNDIYYTNGKIGMGTAVPETNVHIGESQSFLIGTSATGGGNKLMWFPGLAAFRAGTVQNTRPTDWDAVNVGAHSFASGLSTRAPGFASTAMGRDTQASGNYSVATGYFTEAAGIYSTAMGFNTTANGNAATALGNDTRADAFSSFAIGRYNLGGGNSSTWSPGEPVFEIGIGSSAGNRANALTVYKDGYVRVSGSIEVNERIRFAPGFGTLEDGGASEISAGGDVRPSVNNLYDLGTATHRWDDVYATNGTINTSDARDKTAVENLPYGLAEIMQMRPVRYEWIDRPHEGKKLGLIAQDLQPLVTEVVKSFDYQEIDEEQARAALENGERPRMQRVELDRLGVYYSDLIPVLIKAMQEQQALIVELQSEVSTLKHRLEGSQ
jgi:hypothetical protein